LNLGSIPKEGKIYNAIKKRVGIKGFTFRPPAAAAVSLHFDQEGIENGSTCWHAAFTKCRI
jgi:hypothetical protein